MNHKPVTDCDCDDCCKLRFLKNCEVLTRWQYSYVDSLIKDSLHVPLRYGHRAAVKRLFDLAKIARNKRKLKIQSPTERKPNNER